MLFGLWRTTDELQLCGASRSSKWPRVRAEWLRYNPACAFSGATSDLVVHHILPVHRFPEKELDSANLMTVNNTFHLLLCHFGAWQRWNPDVERMAAQYRYGLKTAIERAAS